MSGTTGKDVTARYTNSVMNTFGTPSRVLVRGEGCYVFDADGNRYLDLLAGIAVNALGHAHPTLTSAISAQLGTLGHVSNFFATVPQVNLAETLLRITGAEPGGRVFFTNSGTESNEAAFKMTRCTGRTRILALEGAFHGRTMGALALTAKTAYREPFEPLPGGVEHLEFNDVAVLNAVFDAAIAGESEPIAAIFIEPVQGEAGVRAVSAKYIRAAQAKCREHGALLILDEVQTGIGRTGTWFNFLQHDGIRPDAITLAKGLGGGFPLGAVVALNEWAATLLQPGNHGTTYGGNPVAAVAALATLHTIERDDLMRNAINVGQLIRDQIDAAGVPQVKETAGSGLLLAIRFTSEIAADIQQRLLTAGFITNAVAPDAIRLAPPLIMTATQAGDFVTAFAHVLREHGAEIPSQESTASKEATE